ncbi:hypothetical protein D3C72_587850 [compost metagenome]
MHHGEGTDQRYRHGHQRDDRGTPGLQEQDDDQHHQHQRFEQGVHHGFDGTTDEHGRVIDDAVVHALGEVLLQLGHLRPHFVGDLDGVGAWALEDRDGHRRLVVQQRTQGILAGTEFDPGDVLQAGDFAIGTGADDDVLELFLIDQATLGVDRQLEAGRTRGGWGAQLAGGHLAVLFADRSHHITGGEVARSGLVRVQPHAQRVVAHAEQLHIAHAAQARQLVLDVEDGVVGQVEHVVAVVRRGQVHDHGQVGRGLVDGDTDAGHFLWQLGLGTGDAVLHLHLGVVQVGAQGKGDGQRQLAVSGGLGGHVQHVLHAGNRLLQWRGDGFADDLGVGAGEVGAHHHGGRHHFGVFADRQLEQRDRTRDQQHQRQHRGEDWPGNEEFREVHRCGPLTAWRLGAGDFHVVARHLRRRVAGLQGLALLGEGGEGLFAGHRCLFRGDR